VPSERSKSRALLSAIAAGAVLCVPNASAQSLPPLDMHSPVASRRPLDTRTPFGLEEQDVGRDAFRPAASDAEPRPSSAANYGRPRPRLPHPYPPPRGPKPAPLVGKPPLPQLEPYKTSAIARRARAARKPPPGAEAPVLPPPPGVAVLPAPRAPHKPKLEARPYDPIGVGIGSLRLSPFVEVSGGHDDNPNRLARTANPKPATLLRGDAGFTLRSDWSTHDLQADVRVGYSEYFSQPEANRPDGAGTLAARYDVTRDTSMELRGRFLLDTQRPGAPALYSGLPNVTVKNRPIAFLTGVQVGPTQKFGRLEVSLRGALDRAIYENAQYSDGSTLDLARTNYTQYGGVGRVAYEVSPDLKPFMEATLDTRRHDSATDPYDYRRDSHGYTARGGAELRFSELVHGEASGGYGERYYADVRLPRLRGPLVDAALIYTPTPLTTVTLRGGTTLNETTVTGAAGALSRTVSLTVAHDLMRNLTVSATGGYLNNQYQGANIREEGYSAGVKLEYRITRSITMKASYTHDWLRSTSNGADYTTNVVLVGMRLQL